jgi:hypothetical protein
MKKNDIADRQELSGVEAACPARLHASQLDSVVGGDAGDVLSIANAVGTVAGGITYLATGNKAAAQLASQLATTATIQALTPLKQ